MAFFFKYHPTVEYNGQKLGVKLEGDNFVSSIKQIVRNPLARFKIQEAVKQYASVYYPHVIRDGETAQQIAYQYYDNITYDWVIYFMNDMFDPLFDWPLEYEQFISYIEAKYGSEQWARQNIKKYQYLLRESVVDVVNNFFVKEIWVDIDELTYNPTPEEQDNSAVIGKGIDIPANRKRELSYFAWEEQLNEEKREIVLLKDRYLPDFIKSIRAVFQ